MRRIVLSVLLTGVAATASAQVAALGGGIGGAVSLGTPLGSGALGAEPHVAIGAGAGGTHLGASGAASARVVEDARIVQGVDKSAWRDWTHAKESAVKKKARHGTTERTSK